MNTVLTDIFIYPIKSCKGIRLDSCELDSYGFVHDRRYILVDESGEQMTAREFPSMVLIEPKIIEDGLVIDAPGMSTFTLVGTSGKLSFVTVWESTVEAMDCGDDAADWFGAYLKTPCRLLKMHEGFKRSVEPEHRISNDHFTFADAFPFLLLSKASVNDISERVGENMIVERFRPNILISGVNAFEEDSLHEIQIGEIPFYLARPSGRCILTTVDPHTGIKGKEPLKTLSEYRKSPDGKVLFGMNVIHRKKSGQITVGSPVQILKRKNS